MSAETRFQHLLTLKDLIVELWHEEPNAEIRALLWTAAAALTTVINSIRKAGKDERKERAI